MSELFRPSPLRTSLNLCVSLPVSPSYLREGALDKKEREKKIYTGRSFEKRLINRERENFVERGDYYSLI